MKVSFMGVRMVRVLCCSVLLGGLLWSQNSYGGLFSIPRLIQPKSVGIGLEPEIMFQDRYHNSGTLGMNIRGTYGSAPGSNIHLGFGSGTGTRKFSAMAAVSTELLTDEVNQPGIGVSLGLAMLTISEMSHWNISVAPFVHKMLGLSYALVEPFFAFPVQLNLNNGAYFVSSSLVFGTYVHHSSSWSSLLELGLSFNQSDTYLSGGLIYYY